MISCVNVPFVFQKIIENKFASLIELQTVYSIEDAYNLFEIVTVNNCNEILVRKANDAR